MKLLFIQGGSRVRISKNERKYVDGNFNNDIWKRYNSYCNNLTVILRKIEKKFDESELIDRFNNIDEKLINLKLVDDIYSPKINFLNLKKRKKVKETIEELVKENDRIIIRSVGNFYTNLALKYCKKYDKKYLIEVTGFGFEGSWYHSFFGKLVSIFRELKIRNSIKNAPYVVYVTEETLQHRYPSKGKTLGCSDVELRETNKLIIQERIEKIQKITKEYSFKLGTIGWLDIKYKGQLDIIKALVNLKKNGITNFSYELVGAGKGKRIRKIIEKYNLQNNVKIIGALKHNEVFDWLKKIDIYIHPSYTEGLCRSIIEAISMACPVIATDAGGNPELISNKYIYKKKNVKQFIFKLFSIIELEEMKKQANINFKMAQNFNKDRLEKRRRIFYDEFINEE